MLACTSAGQVTRLSFRSIAPAQTMLMATAPQMYQHLAPDQTAFVHPAVSLVASTWTCSTTETSTWAMMAAAAATAHRVPVVLEDVLAVIIEHSDEVGAAQSVVAAAKDEVAAANGRASGCGHGLQQSHWVPDLGDRAWWQPLRVSPNRRQP